MVKNDSIGHREAGEKIFRRKGAKSQMVRVAKEPVLFSLPDAENFKADQFRKEISEAIPTSPISGLSDKIWARQRQKIGKSVPSSVWVLTLIINHVPSSIFSVVLRVWTSKLKTGAVPMVKQLCAQSEWANSIFYLALEQGKKKFLSPMCLPNTQFFTLINKMCLPQFPASPC